MADEPPLMFARKLGGLYPANQDAERVLQQIDGQVRVEIKRTRGNNRRLALYWIVLGTVAPILSDLWEGDPLTAKMLHRVLKRRAGLVNRTTLPSGEVEYDDESISFHSMTEADRAEFIDWSFRCLAKWTGIPVEVLTSERSAA